MLFVVLALPLLTALLLGTGAERLGRLRVPALVLPLLATLALLLQLGAPGLAGDAAQARVEWVPSLGVDLALRLDALGLVFAVLVALVGSAVMLFAAGYFAKSPRELGRFATLAALFASAMLGVVLADDLFVLFVFWELTSLCSFFLIGFHHADGDAREGAVRALLVTGGGGLAMLLGFLCLAHAAGTSSISELLERGALVRASPLYLPALLLVLTGAFSKSAQVPFHYWLPGAMAAPAPVSAFLHSATLVKAGLYLLARLHPALGHTPEWHLVLGHVGAATMVVGAAMAYAQVDLKRLLAYTTLAGLGTVTLLMGIGTRAGFQAALLFVVVHAVYKAALFMVAGYLEKRTGTRDLDRLGGLARAAPAAFLTMLLAAGSMAGLPPLLGTVSKELLYEAKLGVPEAPVLLIVLSSLANALLVATAIRIVVRPFFGGGSAPAPRAALPHVRLLGGAALLGALSLAAGLFPDLFVAPWLGASVGATDPDAATTAWIADARPELASWLPKLTMFVGLLLFLAQGRVERVRAWGAVLARWGPQRAHAVLFAALAEVGRRIGAWCDSRVVPRSALLGFLALVIAGAVLLGSGIAEEWPDVRRPRLHEAALVLIVLAGSVATAILRSRRAAIAAMGTLGFGVGLLFLLLGAPDVALTQLTVETLVVLLLVFMLPRLRGVPAASRSRTPRPWVWVHAALALGVGLTLGALTWAAAPDGDLRPTAEELLARSWTEAFGRNVVNVILVDFRALDTLGELLVLACAGLGVVALLRSREGSAP